MVDIVTQINLILVFDDDGGCKFQSAKFNLTATYAWLYDDIYWKLSYGTIIMNMTFHIDVQTFLCPVSYHISLCNAAAMRNRGSSLSSSLSTKRTNERPNGTKRSNEWTLSNERTEGPTDYQPNLYPLSDWNPKVTGPNLISPRGIVTFCLKMRLKIFVNSIIRKEKWFSLKAQCDTFSSWSGE